LGIRSRSNVVQHSELPCSYYHHTQGKIEFDLHYQYVMTELVAVVLGTESSAVVTVALEHLLVVPAVVQVVYLTV
jgi:hypothetical protein